jgi:dipeptidyl-peptidase-4
MNMQKGIIFALLVTSIIVVTPFLMAQEEEQTERDALFSRYISLVRQREAFSTYFRRGMVEPHWMRDGYSFWYSDGSDKNIVIYKVDPKANTKTEFFDTARLQKNLIPLLGYELPHTGLPFKEFEFMDMEQAVRFRVDGKSFSLKLDSCQISEVPLEKKPRWGPRSGDVLSPDGKWVATIKDYDLWIRSVIDGNEVKITDDGIEDFSWVVGSKAWSPNSTKLAIFKRDYRLVPKEPFVHWIKPVPTVDWRRSRGGRADGPDWEEQLYLVDVQTRKISPVETGKRIDHGISFYEWLPDSSGLLIQFENRERTERKWMIANPQTGSTRMIMVDSTDTLLPRVTSPHGFFFVDNGKSFIRRSRADGWFHLYLYDLDGNLITRLTEGRYEVDRLVTVDEKSGWVYFTAQDPQCNYYMHLFRVSLNGKRFERITEAPANHDGDIMNPGIRFSPSKEYFIDTYSTPNSPPVVELRKADGTLMQTLSEVKIEWLKEKLKWEPPEVFTVTTDDAKIDHFGILYKPYDFDPNKSYPIIQVLDPYPSRCFIPWTLGITSQALANCGFIVFAIGDRRGRDKEFEEAMWEKCRTAEEICIMSYNNVIDPVPESLATIYQLAQERPYIDISRVGVYGISASGAAALLLMLKAPDTYHVGVSIEPCYVDPYSRGFGPCYSILKDQPDAYDKYSLTSLADKLKGKLLLIHPTADRSCHLSNTIKMIDALIKANKPYDLILLPDENHGLSAKRESWPYVWEAIRRHFLEHLKPDLN